MTLRLNAVTKSYGGNVILENISMELKPGARLGLVGPNGSGKSTLLKIIAGFEEADGGTVVVPGSIALLSQEPEQYEGTALDALQSEELRQAEQALQYAAEQLADATEVNLEKYAQAEEQYRSLGGYDHGVRAEAVLTGLGVNPGAVCATLSGGEQRRLQLARLLLQPADVFFLDEPTNHLDIEGITWLENWLHNQQSTLLIVSHDRDFLDKTTTSTALIERGRIRTWPGSWSTAMAIRANEDAARQRRRDAALRRRHDLEAEANRLASQARSAGKFNKRRAGNQALILAKAKAENVSRTLARRAEALRQRAEEIEITEALQVDHNLADVPLPEYDTGPGEVLHFKNLTLTRGDRTLVQGLDLLLRRGEKIAVTGPNGSGKTTLLNTVIGDHVPTAGGVIHGRNLRIFVMSQDGRDLDETETVADALLAAQPSLRRQDLHHLLARLGLPVNPAAAVSTLSGGERGRLALARLSITRAALLVLDEPTNNLDIPMTEALEKLLADYPGAVLFTTHDRRLLRAVADRTINLSAGPDYSRSAGSSSPR